MTVGQGDGITASLAFYECKPQVRHEVLSPLSRQEKGVALGSTSFSSLVAMRSRSRAAAMGGYPACSSIAGSLPALN